VSQYELMPSGFSSPLIYRIWWSGNCSTAEMSLANVRMLALTWQYDQAVRHETLSKYLSGPALDFRFSRCAFQRSTCQITPGSRFDLLLSSVQGLVTEMTLIVRVSGSPIAIDAIDIKDNSGNNVIGGSSIPFEFADTILRAERGGLYKSNNSDVEMRCYHIPIGLHQHIVSVHGQIGAYIPCDGRDHLGIWLNSTTYGTDTVACEVTVLYKAASVLRIERGNVAVSHS
jgi:hypothetical protein